ncbi:MAG TPA: hypothetical protein VJQ51_01265 [Burkholderiales bacterium]|nr:hypothetical protein [Burkholderiales bacterium]
MSRILFAWELGGGYGHLGPFRPIADALLARGHELTIAAREVQSATAIFGALPVRIVQAPLCIKTYKGLEEPPLNFAEILMRYGYFDAPQLSGLLQAWRGLLDMTQAETVVADHAPTALLATRGRAVTRVVIGSPFAVPPPLNPTPNMRSWVNVPEQRLISSDASVLKVINASQPADVPPLGAVHEIFDGASGLLTGVPELDPYGSRDSLCYMGLTGGRTGTLQPRWPEGDGPRTFVYLNNDYRHIEAVLATLAASAARCLVCLLGATPALVEKYQGPRVVFSSGMLDLEAAVAGSDFCICHGNVGTVMNILRGAKPMLLFPMQLEHFLLSAKLEKLGIAGVVHPEREPLDIANPLARVMQDESMSGAARAFARKHREPSVDTILERATSRIEARARTQDKPG